MSVDIKPIETRYAGCRFRSRLEARWAVFFDQFGLRWEYEPQGYEVGTTRYLPDFLLTDLGLFVEVKAVLGYEDFMKMAKAIPLLRPMDSRQMRPSLLLLGPVPPPGTAWLHVQFSMLEDRFLWHHIYFHDGHTIPHDQPLSFGSGPVANPDDENLRYFLRIWTQAQSWPRLTVDPEVDAAYAAARSARFEFGESG